MLKARRGLSSFPGFLGGKPVRAERACCEAAQLQKGFGRGEAGVRKEFLGVGGEKAADGCNGMHGGVRGNRRLRRQKSGSSREGVKLGNHEVKRPEI